MKILTRDIPSAFIELDTEVTANDRFLNVRDLQVVRSNHNILAARTHHRALLNASVSKGYPDSDTTNGYTEYFNRGYIGVVDTRAAAEILRFRIAASQLVQQLDLRMLVACSPVAAGGSAAGACNIYPVVSIPKLQRPLATATVVNFTNHLYVWRNVTVPVPVRQYLNDGRHTYDFSLYFVPETQGSLHFGGYQNVTAATTTTVSYATTGTDPVPGYLIVFNDADIEPRVVVDVSSSGGTTTVTAGIPWTLKAPSSSVPDTCNFAEASTLRIKRVQLFEKPVTDFDAVPDYI